MSYKTQPALPLPDGIEFEELREFCPERLWRMHPERAFAFALAASGRFDCADYLQRYPDVARAGVDPICHFASHGLRENRIGNLLNSFRSCNKSKPVLMPNSPARSYAVVILLDQYSPNPTLQYRAIMRQSLKPAQIIYALCGTTLSGDEIRAATSHDVLVLEDAVGSGHALSAAAIAANADYMVLADADFLPGELWMANALRASSAYAAIAVAKGSLYSAQKENFVDVTPASPTSQNISCATTDIFCDWGRKCLVFRREWLTREALIIQGESFPRLLMLLALNLWLREGVKCVTPMQPAFEPRLGFACGAGMPDSVPSASLKNLFNEALASGYIPICQRKNLFKFHVISTFGHRRQLDRCLASLKGQVYANYTCTFIDDSCDGVDVDKIISKHDLHSGQFRYLRNQRKLFMAAGPQRAIDMLPANPADIVVTLDGDDWFAHPHVLWQLNALYRLGRTRATYSNSFEFTSWKTRNFNEFSEWRMTTRWNCARNDPYGDIPPVRMLAEAETCDGWASAPWCHYHTRSYFYAEWLAFGGETLAYGDGKKVHSPGDMVVLVPIFDNCANWGLHFTNEPSYVYQHVRNTSEFSPNHNILEHQATFSLVTHRKRSSQPLYRILRHLEGNYPEMPAQTFSEDFQLALDNIRPYDSCPSQGLFGDKTCKSSIATIATPGEIADALFLLINCMRNCEDLSHAYLFLLGADAKQKIYLQKLLYGSRISLLLPQDVTFQAKKFQELQCRYDITHPYLLRAAKPILALELLDRGNDSVLFMDPTQYVVADIDDICSRDSQHPFVAYPCFYMAREGKKDVSDAADGAINDGLFSCTQRGKNVLERWHKLNLAMPSPVENAAANPLDALILESDAIYINKDQGIGYSVLRNRKRAYGLIAPSQKSYLLAHGAYVRVWHMDPKLIKAIINGNPPDSAGTRPPAIIYCLSLLLTGLLIVIKVRGFGGEVKSGIPGLQERFNELADYVTSLAKDVPLSAIKSLWDALMEAPELQPDKALDDWLKVFQQSICYENSETFVRMIEQLFPQLDTFAIVEKLHAEDLRYLTEDVLASPRLTEEAKGAKLKNVSGGEITGQQLAKLKACHIWY